ncbi:MAG: 50S ribosomal protein L25 [Pirellulaceae bacterium]
MSDAISVKKRDETGTLRMRRLRKAGHIPAVLYGHGQETVALTLSAREVEKLVRAGRHIVELKGDVSESALVKNVQWDAFGSDILHLDLARVDASESVEVTISIDFRGVAPGTRSGGVVKHVMHEVGIRCPANKLPEHLEISINELELDGVITAGEISLPAAAELIGDPGDVVVTCVPPTVTEELDDEEAAAGVAAEPEVIGRKSEDEESAEGGDS